MLCWRIMPLFLGCSASATAGPVWERPSLFLGSLELDGGLRQRFELGVLSGSPEFSFPIYLEHGFRGEDPVTEYKIPQLETYVVPEGRDQILWLEPGGIRHVFKSAEILQKAPEKQKEPWIAIEAGAGNHEFRSDDGWIYRYESGSISSLTAPTGRKLLFTTDGLRIRRIFQVAGGKEINLLDSTDNDPGQAENLRIGADTHLFKYSSESDQLISWHSPRMGSNSVTFSYSSEGLVERVSLPGDRALTYVWGARDGAWQKESGFELPPKENGAFLIADSDFKFRYGIDKSGINLMRTDALGVSEGFSFNPGTQQLVRKNRDGGETTEFFGLRGAAENRLESVRDARGRETVRMTYDGNGRLETTRSPGKAPIRFEYDPLGRVTRVFRQGEVQKRYEYHGGSDKPVKITDALGNSIEIGYNAAGQVLGYKNLDGVDFSFKYDDLGQLVEMGYPLGYKKSIARDDFGRIVSVREIDGKETRYRYTEDNRLASADAEGVIWDYEYDQDGLLARLMKDGKDWQTAERLKSPLNDGRILKQRNADGDETVTHFDKSGRLLKQRNAEGEETSYKHDALGRITGFEDERGLVARLERDAVGRVVSLHENEEGALKVHYDERGRMKSRTTGGELIEYFHNQDGLLAEVRHGGKTHVRYSYDGYGRMVMAETSRNVRTSYVWDQLDRKIEERNDLPGGMWTLVRWAYTPSGKARSVKAYQNGDDAAHLVQDSDYEYDKLGRYERILVNGSPKISYKYDPGSLRISEKVFSNGWTVSYSHHADGQPKSMLVRDGGGTVMKSIVYSWDSLKRLVGRQMDGVAQKYEYDAKGRLVSAGPDEGGQETPEENGRVKSR